MKRDPRKTPEPQPELGVAIRAQRKRHGFSQEGLASKAGIAPGTLSLIERGEANPTWGTVRRLAAALGVSVSDLAKAAEDQER